ncbi:MAG: hypothetical protein IH577_03840 [Deltaproteobacteria bacterium]|nr:hypothetical protein [Deltaproteobacteria bacterium]
MSKTGGLEEEAEGLWETLERRKLLALYKKYKYIWGIAYIVGLIVLFTYIRIAGNPGVVKFLLFVITFGLVVIYVHRKIGMSYQRERKIITEGKEELYPFM